METALPQWLIDFEDEHEHDELVDGVIAPAQMSPSLLHGQIAGRLCGAVLAWAPPRDVVGIEVRFRLRDGKRWQTVIPDVCYIPAAQIAAEEHPDLPQRAPLLAIEVRSPDDRQRRIDRKTELYLAFGARVVINIDPVRRMVEVVTAAERVRESARGRFAVPACDGLVIDWDEIFAGIPASGAPRTT